MDVKSELSKLDGLLEQVQKDDGSDTQKLESGLPPIHKEDKKTYDHTNCGSGNQYI